MTSHPMGMLRAPLPNIEEESKSPYMKLFLDTNV
ncbi:unnamed protein product [Larinioides sclopetarius]